MTSDAVWPAYFDAEISGVGVTLKGMDTTITDMDSATEGPPPSLGLVLFLIVTPIVAGVSLFLLFETGPIHRLGMYLIGAGVLVGGFLLLWQRM